MVALLDQLNHSNLSSPGALEAAFVSTPMGQLVTATVHSFQQALLSFIMDLVQMKVGAHMSGPVLNIICVAVFKLAKHTKATFLRHEVSAEIEEGLPQAEASVSMAPICLSPVDIYEAVQAVLPRLHLCVRVISLVPDVEKKLSEDDLSNEAFSLDIQVLQEALDMMDPVGSELLSPSARHVWGGRVTNLSTLLKQLEGLLSREPEAAPEDQSRMIATRLKCQRLEIIKLFLDHMLQSDVNPLLQETVSSNLRLVFAALKNPDFSTSRQTFDKLRHAIENCCRKVGLALLGFKDVQECVLCLESVRQPVILPCGHIGCPGCLRDAFQVDSAARVCPRIGCQKAIPEDFKFLSDAKMGRAAAEHARFRGKISQFFIEMIQRFVFVKGEMPHQVHLCI